MRDLKEAKVSRKLLQLWEARSQVNGLLIAKKKNKPKEANVVNNVTKYVSDINLTTVISEVNLVGSNLKGGSILALPTMYALTRRCSPPFTQLRLGKRCS